MGARVVIFEDYKEVQRVFKYIFREQSEENANNITLLTSAMYFEDVKEWVYLGTSKIKMNYFKIFLLLLNITQNCNSMSFQRSCLKL